MKEEYVNTRRSAKLAHGSNIIHLLPKVRKYRSERNPKKDTGNGRMWGVPQVVRIDPENIRGEFPCFLSYHERYSWDKISRSLKAISSTPILGLRTACQIFQFSKPKSFVSSIHKQYVKPRQATVS